ncbi:MAG: hypothetical protein B6D37_07520 [Sphingobacteriales bacterium UTBCD1]|jgi:hypothetical protein|nr:MAG: hypothetical protein B6D37_07520 [Sphingobacteriales bacterium UTBCD1]
MPYLETIKANSDVFEKIKIINVQNKYVLKPIIPDMLDAEAMIYMLNAQSDGVKEFLPGAYVSNQNEAKAKLPEHIIRMVSYVGILYCIRPIDEQMPIGYIMLNSPKSNTGIPDWTIDFWMNNRYRRHGILAASLSELLQHL